MLEPYAERVEACAYMHIRCVYMDIHTYIAYGSNVCLFMCARCASAPQSLEIKVAKGRLL